MRMHPFHRTELLLGTDGWSRLQGASVAVIGLGGVGSYAAEALARSGVGHLTLVDHDDVCLTNLNRQLHATRETVGQDKAELMGARCRAIARKADIRVMSCFYEAATADQILDRRYDLVLDCIDNMTAKLDLHERCFLLGQPILGAMGAGGRLDPTQLQVTHLHDTHTDPFARIVREELRKRQPEANPLVVWSAEPPNDLDPVVQDGFRCICPDKANSPHSCDRRLQVQGSVAWLPSIMGLTMAGAAVMELLERPVRSPVRAKRRQKGGMKPSQGKPSGLRKKELLASVGLGRLEVRSASTLPPKAPAPASTEEA